MGNIVIVGLGELRTLFGACEQFVGGLWKHKFQALMIVDFYGMAPRYILIKCSAQVSVENINEELCAKIHYDNVM